MSKLDDILIELIEAVNPDAYMVKSRNVARKEVKNLFLELVGEDVGLDGDAYGIHEAQNDLRAELRKKVEEL